MPLAGQGEVSEDLPHSLAEAADLDETGLDGGPQAHGDEQEDEDVAGQVRVGRLYDGQERVLELLKHLKFPS